MRLSGLPTMPRPRPVLSLTLHLANGIFAGVLASSLTANALILWHTASGGATSQVLLLALLFAGECALAAWLILRRARIRRLVHGARASLLRGDLDGARWQFGGLLAFAEYRANPAPVLYGLAVADAWAGDEPAALELLRAAGSHEPSMELRALLLIRSGSSGKAVRVARLLLKQRPSDPRIWLLCAAAEQAAGRREAARDTLDEARKLLPSAGLLEQASQSILRGDSLLELTSRLAGMGHRTGG